MASHEKEISRRTFLKSASSIGVVAASAATPLTQAHAEPLRVPSAEYGREKKVPVLCQMCAQFCPANACVKDGKVIRLEAGPVHEYSGTCGRSRAAPGALYSADRITTPLIRTGERGEGKFRQASWDEALDLIAQKLKKLRDDGEPEKVVLFSRFSSAMVWDMKFFDLYGTPNNVSYGDTCYEVVSRSSQTILGFGGPGSHSSDYENADYGLIVGKNLGGSIIPHGWGAQFGKGLRHGLPLTLVDPRHPNEMAQSYAEWLCIRPGTDLSFLLGVLHFVVLKGYVDGEFLPKTNLDALIDQETLLPVKLDREAKPNDYLVFDTASRSFVMSRTATAPAYEGRYEYNGAVVQPAMELMKKTLLDLNPQKLAEICTIPATKMEGVADKLHAAAPKAFVEIGYRWTRHTTDLRAQICVHTLNMLLGLYGREGGVLQNRSVKFGGLPVEFPKPDMSKSILKWKLDNEPERWLASPVEGRSGIIQAVLDGKPYKPKMFFIWGQDLIGGTAGGKDVTDAFKSVESIVAVSPFWSDSVMYADVIVPGCTFLEQDQPFFTYYKCLIPVIGVNRKAVDPVMGSKDGYWILCQIAKRVLSPDEYKRYFLQLEREGIRPTWESQFAGVTKQASAGLTPEELNSLPPTLDDLLEHGSWGTRRIVLEQKPKTATGKFEVYSFELAEKYDKLKKTYPDYQDRMFASPLPVHLEPRWMRQKPELGADEFVPATGFTPLSSFAGAQARDNPILVALHHRMRYANVFINEERARLLDLKEGDLVEVWMAEYPDEKQEAVLSVSNIVHRDVLFSYHGLGKGLQRTTEKFQYARKNGINLNHFGRLRFSPGVCGHTPQDIVLKIRKVS
ncbi:MAG: molybdopterin-dependent oxidoreductase [Syntrophobacteraceae bacterium]